MYKNYTRISSTAYHVAAARAHGTVTYADAIAKLCDTEKRTEHFFKENGHVVDIARMRSFTHAMVQRLYSTYAAVRNTGIPRVLELASGLSPLGLIATESKHRIYIETDLPEIIEEKQRIVHTITTSPRQNLSFTHHDVMSHASWERIVSLLARDDRPLGIVSEGLLMYLSYDERSALYDHIHNALQVLGGMWVTPDIVLKKYVCAGAARSARTQEMYNAYVRGTGCDTATYAYESYEDAVTHLKQHGLHVHWRYQTSLAPRAVPHDVLEKSTYLRDQRVAIVHAHNT